LHLPARIAVTPGEPAGIGPDLVIQLAGEDRSVELVAIASADMLRARAEQLGVPLRITRYDPDQNPQPGTAGKLVVCDLPLAEPSTPGQLNAANSDYVLATLRRAASGCLNHEFAAMLTAPVQKSIINEIPAGEQFTGHTEYLADLCDVATPVMLLCADELRVALLTTHLPLAEVPAAVTAPRIEAVCAILDSQLQRLFGIAQPRIAILGLNPHAGEAGRLGREELDVILPAIKSLRSRGLQVTGPLPADSAFTPASLEQFDAVLAMYHDQGLPVLKHKGFGNAVNVTLGLPIIRTSVDHGTALELAGTGKAHAGSLRAALDMAIDLAKRSAQ
jgi:4-hydroxythreonine-4-phosphate dehydrogenase